MAIKFKAIITVWPLQSDVKYLIYVWYYLKCSFWHPNWFSEGCAMPQISTLLMEKIFPMEVLPSIRECGCTPTPQRLCVFQKALAGINLSLEKSSSRAWQRCTERWFGLFSLFYLGFGCLCTGCVHQHRCNTRSIVGIHTMEAKFNNVIDY